MKSSNIYDVTVDATGPILRNHRLVDEPRIQSKSRVHSSALNNTQVSQLVHIRIDLYTLIRIVHLSLVCRQKSHICCKPIDFFCQ